MEETSDDMLERDLVERLKLPADCGGLISLEKEAVVELISISRSTEGRAKLGPLRLVASIVGLLQRFLEEVHGSNDPSCSVPRASDSPSSPSPTNELLDRLLFLLKLTRNLCAGDSTNQDALLDSGGVQIFTSITRTLLSFGGRQAQVHDRSPDLDSQSNALPDEDATVERIIAQLGSNTKIYSTEKGHTSASPAVVCLKMMLQLLGNFSRHGEACQAAVWDNFFPSLVLELAALHVEEIYEPLCMVLYNCCQCNSLRCWELCQGNGAAVLALLMETNLDDAVSSSSVQIEWFELLVQHLCLQEPLFALLFVNLGVFPSKRKVERDKMGSDDVLAVCRLSLETSTLTSLHARLLYILCDCLNCQVSSYPVSSVSADQNEQYVRVLPMPTNSMCFMVDILRTAAQGAVDDAGVSPVPTITTASCTVQILGFVLSIWRMLFAWDSSPGDCTQMATCLLSHGFVDLLLSLLEVLGPPGTRGKDDTGEMSWKESPPRNFGEFPCQNPYLGYRRDIVAVIANISHRNTHVQDRVREKGGLLLVLQQCVVDEDSPYLREWALWAMRNLLEGNERNQQEISQLEVTGSVNLPELQKMGLSVQIDPNTRRPRLVNESPSSLRP